MGTRIGPRLDDPSLAISQQPPACWAGGSSCEYGTLFDRLVWKAADTVDSQSASFYLQQKVNPGFAIEKAGVNYISPELPTILSPPCGGLAVDVTPAQTLILDGYEVIFCFVGGIV